MLEVERPGDELAWRAFSSARKVAWKTGTSYGFRDAWAVGVTPGHAVGVWVGNGDGEGRPGLTGHSAAAPVLFDVFDALPGGGWFSPPAEGLEDVDVCARSGMRAGPHCETRRAELVPRAGLDSPPCSFCRLVHTDAAVRWQVHGDCEPAAAMPLRRVVRPAAGAGDPLPAVPRGLPPAAALPARLPRRARRLRQRLALLRLPARGRRRLRPRRDGRLGRAGRLRGGRTATPRPGSSGTSTTSTRARRATSTRWRSPPARGRTCSSSWTSGARPSGAASPWSAGAGAVLLRFPAGL